MFNPSLGSLHRKSVDSDAYLPEVHTASTIGLEMCWVLNFEKEDGDSTYFRNVEHYVQIHMMKGPKSRIDINLA
jgi:hypothetical protein